MLHRLALTDPSCILLIAALLFTAAVPARGQETTRYTHPQGLTFEHPTGWQVQPGQDGQMIVLLPGDAKRDAAGNPLELFIIGGEAAPGIARPDDPQVLAYFDNELAGMVPGIQRTGTPETIDTGLGAGALLTYAGVNPAGLSVRPTIYVTLHQGTGLFMLHIAEAETAARLDATARRIFGSFDWSASAPAPPTAAATPANGTLDPALVRAWSRNEHEYSGGASGYVGANTQINVQFAADGTCAYGSDTSIAVDTGGAAAYGESDPNANVSRCRWTTSGSTLYITWDGGGQETFEYRVFMHEGAPALKLQAPGGDPKYFQ